MINSPKTLKHLCLDVVSKKFAEIFIMQSKPLPVKRKRNSDRKLKASSSSSDFYLPCEIAEHLITSLSRDGKFSEEYLNVFNVEHACLRKVILPNCDGTQSKHFKFLMSHKITELEICGSSLQFDETIQWLGEWSRENLRYLSVPRSVFLPRSISSVSFKSLRNLRYCNVSQTNFNTLNLEALIRDCALLEGLDISETEVKKIGCLVQVKDSLKTLKMYKLPICDKTIVQLSKLQFLDISTEDETMSDLGSTEFNVESPVMLQNILTHPNALKNIISFDVSGRRAISISAMRQFILSHSKLRFLGLFFDDSLCSEPMLRDKNHPDFNPNLKVAGTASQEQILMALDKYRMRAEYIHSCIYNLITFAVMYNMKSVEVRTEFVRVIIEIIKQNPAHAVESISVYCLSFLIKHSTSINFHPNLLLEVVELCLDLLEKYPNDMTVHKYVLIILQQQYLEELEGIDKCRYCKLALESMCTFKNELIIKMAVNIAATLATRMSNEETTKIGTNKKFMKKFLTIVKEKVVAVKVDNTFTTTLTTLWNLTDESPKTCSTFISNKGLELFELALDAFSGDGPVETDIIGILSNIAEVKSLRKNLLKPKIVSRLRSFLKNEEIDISFYAADILVHLASDGEQCWTLEKISRANILKEIHFVITNKWKSPGREIAAYRSFTPYIHLLKCSEPAVQLFGAWAIHHVCFENPCRYVQFLKEKKLSDCLDRLCKQQNLQVDVKKLVLKLVEYRENPSFRSDDNCAG
nr:PREDICTED: protein zyg-11 homolog B-like [Bemisia tabaci]